MSKILDYIYGYLPIFGQNLACTAKGLQIHFQRYNKHFRNYLSWLRESEWWDAEKIYDYQCQKIQWLIPYAYENVPYYRKIFDLYGINPAKIKTPKDISKLPILTKQLAKENQDNLISIEFKKSKLLRMLTSGTTGTALAIYFTRKSLAFQWAVCWRHKSRFGMKPGDKYLSFGARIAVPPRQNKTPFWRRNWVGNQVYLSTYHMTSRNLPAISDWLDMEYFDFYTGYPSAMYVLAEYLLENERRLLLRPKYVVCGADALLPRFEKAIHEAFGVLVTEQYGMTEFAGNMAKCEQGKFHLDFECCYVEEQPIIGSDGEANLLFTGWGNPAMPFIRYEVGDYGKRRDEVCSCGRKSICFDGIDGRTEDYVVTPDGRMAIGMNQVFEYAPGAKEIQIYQDNTNSIDVRIVRGHNYGPNDESALIRELRRRVGEELKIEFVFMDEIPRTKSGKFRAVVSKLPKAIVNQTQRNG